jgi:hypothetical protein
LEEEIALHVGPSAVENLENGAEELKAYLPFHLSLHLPSKGKQEMREELLFVIPRKRKEELVRARSGGGGKELLREQRETALFLEVFFVLHAPNQLPGRSLGILEDEGSILDRETHEELAELLRRKSGEEVSPHARSHGGRDSAKALCRAEEHDRRRRLLENLEECVPCLFL